MRTIMLAFVSIVLAQASAATELKSFYGVKFGTEVSNGDFEGPDEDGDYTFLPKGKTADPIILYQALVTHSSKKVYGVNMVHVVARSVGHDTLEKYVKELNGKYGSVWYVPNKLETHVLYEAFRASLPGVDIKKNDYFVRCFKNDDDDICQILQAYVVTVDGVTSVAVCCSDSKLSDLDDAEKAKSEQGAQKVAKEVAKEDAKKEPGELTGADIIKGNDAKERGYSNAQRDKICKQLKGRQLTFENGVVEDVRTDDNDSVRLCVSFGRKTCYRFEVYATIARSQAELAAELDKGTKIKSLTGFVEYNPGAPVFFINKATFSTGK